MELREMMEQVKGSNNKEQLLEDIKRYYAKQSIGRMVLVILSGIIGVLLAIKQITDTYSSDAILAVGMCLVAVFSFFLFKYYRKISKSNSAEELLLLYDRLKDRTLNVSRWCVAVFLPFWGFLLYGMLTEILNPDSEIVDWVFIIIFILLISFFLCSLWYVFSAKIRSKSYDASYNNITGRIEELREYVETKA